MTLVRPGLLALALSIAVAVDTLAATAPELPRLAGTIIAPGSRHAMIEVGAQQHGVAPGDDLAGWVVQSIAPGHVVLLGPDGPVSLSVADRVPVPALDAAVPRAAFDWNNPCGRRHGAIGRHDTVACHAAMLAVGRP